MNLLPGDLGGDPELAKSAIEEARARDIGNKIPVELNNIIQKIRVTPPHHKLRLLNLHNRLSELAASAGLDASSIQINGRIM